jgi:signal transduction histidine kinase
MVTAIRPEHGPWPTGEPVWQTRAIAIPYGALLAIEFCVLDLRPPHRFAYRLGGENEPWIDLGARREIVFAGLQPGRYSLSVRGLNGRGVWTESAHALEIRVPTPLWMAWWFRALLLGGGAAVASVWVRARFVALERRSRELARLHQDRELALAQLRTSQSDLHEAYESLRRLTRRLEQAKEDERRHIARELHDEMGQALSAMKINLKALDRIEHEPPARRRFDDAISLVDGIIGHVRTLSLDLRPQLLEELGLLAAVRNYAESQSFRSGVAIQVESNSDADDLPPELAIAAFRIVQESIHNALRHARASSIAVAMRHDLRRLSLSVTDDGRGFDVAEAMRRATSGRHLGLLGMRERVESLGGTLKVDSGAGRGTTVHAVLPIDVDGLEP